MRFSELDREDAYMFLRNNKKDALGQRQQKAFLKAFFFSVLKLLKKITSLFLKGKNNHFVFPNPVSRFEFIKITKRTFGKNETLAVTALW